MDGKGADCPSKNGTWLYCMEDLMLFDDDLIKAGHSLFRVNISNGVDDFN